MMLRAHNIRFYILHPKIYMLIMPIPFANPELHGSKVETGPLLSRVETKPLFITY